MFIMTQDLSVMILSSWVFVLHVLVVANALLPRYENHF